MTNLTDAELDELLELRRKATAAAPVPWDHGPLMSDGYRYSQVTCDLLSLTRVGVVVDTLNADSVFNEQEREVIARFIVSAANNVESLVTEVKRLRDKLDDVLNDLYHLTNDGNSATLSAFRYIIAVQKELARTKESQ